MSKNRDLKVLPSMVYINGELYQMSGNNLITPADVNGEDHKRLLANVKRILTPEEKENAINTMINNASREFCNHLSSHPDELITFTQAHN